MLSLETAKKLATPFNKTLDTLESDEQAILEASLAVLAAGDRLYGINQEDTSHIAYAVGLTLHELKAVYAQEHKPLMTAVEIGLDESGWFVSFIKDTNTQS